MSSSSLGMDGSVYFLNDRLNQEDLRVNALPVGLKEIEVNKLPKPELSVDLLDKAIQLGFKVSHIPFRLYSESKFGKFRLRDNSEMYKGYPMYGKTTDTAEHKLSRMVTVRNALIELAKIIENEVGSVNEGLLIEEIDNLNKFNFQRPQRMGRHLALPVDFSTKDVEYPVSFIEIINKILDLVIKTDTPVPRDKAILSVIDAVGTAPGGPSFQNPSDDQYNYHRLVTFADAPIPNYAKAGSDFYLQDMLDYASKFPFPDPFMAYMSYVSFRQGSKIKPQLEWFPTMEGWLAYFETVSFESNQRLVYPSSALINFDTTAATLKMKRFRKRKLGLYHTPDLAKIYIPKLQKQGKFSFVSDFSSFDTTITNRLMVHIFERLATIAPDIAWECQYLVAWLKNSGVISPSFLSGDPNSVTLLRGPIGLLSGWLFTSEIGSIVSLAANLWTLQHFDKDIFAKWVSGNFTILIQSDDVCFTWNDKIDPEAFSEVMSNLGFKSKLMEGSTFLKLILPLGTLMSKLKDPSDYTRLLSRLNMQTWGNEFSYDGDPEAIVRLGLYSRATYIKNHPCWTKNHKSYQLTKDLLSSSPLFAPTVDNFDEGVKAMSQSDVTEIFNYCSTTKGNTWLSKYVNQIDQNPNARNMLISLHEMGLSLEGLTDSLLDQRRAYFNARNSAPTSESHANINSILNWTS